VISTTPKRTIWPPETPIPSLPGTTLGDFWSWAFSDIVSNATRGVYAEFLVAKCLGLESLSRLEWDKADLEYGESLIEVKSSAYLQSLRHDKLSDIQFDVGKKRILIDGTNKYEPIPRRCAHCYVFALHAAKDETVADPLIVTQWRFFVMSVSEVANSFGRQKSAALARIESVDTETSYGRLRAVIDDKLRR
jgi:hypothetical protein